MIENGVAVGHRGTVLLTQDGGATWQGTKVDAKEQNALLSVWIEGKDGIAVGAYGTYLETHDAGQTWAERRIVGADFDRHLNAVVAGKDGAMLIAGEAGTLAVSHGPRTQLGPAQVALRGHVLRSPRLERRSDPRIRHAWHRVADRRQRQELGHGRSRPYKGAVQNGAELPDGSVVLVGAGGLVASSRDKGVTFKVQQTKDRRHIGSVVFGSSGQLLIAGEGGARWTDFTLPR